MTLLVAIIAALVSVLAIAASLRNTVRVDEVNRRVYNIDQRARSHVDTITDMGEKMATTGQVAAAKSSVMMAVGQVSEGVRQTKDNISREATRVNALRASVAQELDMIRGSVRNVDEKASMAQANVRAIGSATRSGVSMEGLNEIKKSTTDLYGMISTTAANIDQVGNRALATQEIVSDLGKDYYGFKNTMQEAVFGLRTSSAGLKNVAQYVTVEERVSGLSNDFYGYSNMLAGLGSTSRDSILGLSTAMSGLSNDYMGTKRSLVALNTDYLGTKSDLLALSNDYYGTATSARRVVGGLSNDFYGFSNYMSAGLSRVSQEAITTMGELANNFASYMSAGLGRASQEAITTRLANNFASYSNLTGTALNNLSTLVANNTSGLADVTKSVGSLSTQLTSVAGDVTTAKNNIATLEQKVGGPQASVRIGSAAMASVLTTSAGGDLQVALQNGKTLAYGADGRLSTQAVAAEAISTNSLTIGGMLLKDYVTMITQEALEKNMAIVAATATAAVPTTGLVAWFDFTNDGRSYSGSGTSVTDLSNNKYNLAFSNPVRVLTSPYGIEFNPNVAAISLAKPNINMSNGYTIELLFRYSTNTNDYFKLFSYTFANDGNGVQIQVTPDNRIYMWNNSNNIAFACTQVLKANTWYHFVITVTGSATGVIYINGVAQNSTGSLARLANMARYITLGDQDRSRSITGHIALARFYNVALTAPNVGTLYNAARAAGGYGI